MAGRSMTPTSGPCSSTSASSVAYSGTPRTNPRVPSIVSMIHVRPSRRMTPPSSSPKIASCGNRCVISSRARRSAARSASVTSVPVWLPGHAQIALAEPAQRQLTRQGGDVTGDGDERLPPQEAAQRPRLRAAGTLSFVSSAMAAGAVAAIRRHREGSAGTPAPAPRADGRCVQPAGGPTAKPGGRTRCEQHDKIGLVLAARAHDRAREALVAQRAKL